MLEEKILFKNVDFELWCHPGSLDTILADALIKIIIKYLGDTAISTNPYLSPNSLLFRPLTEKGVKIVARIRKELEIVEKSKTY